MNPKFAQDLNTAIGSGESLIQVCSDEAITAMESIATYARAKKWAFSSWMKTDEKSVIAAVSEFAASQEEAHSLLVILNGNLVFDSQFQLLIAAFQQFARVGKVNKQHILFICVPSAKFPPEIASLLHPIQHPLPDVDERREIATNFTTSKDIKPPTKEEIDAVVASGNGLTRAHFEGVCAQSMSTQRRLDPQFVAEKKLELINGSGFVTLTHSEVGFEALAGLDGLKAYSKRLFARRTLEQLREQPEVRAKGILLLGPPGTGKSWFAATLSAEMGLPLLSLNPGNLMGGLVGDTERNTREFFDLVRIMAPCFVLVDEVAKAMPSGTERGEGSDVGRRMVASFLTNMNDIKEQVFWLFTENSIAGMTSAFFRAERVDAKFYVGLPDEEQRAEAWKIYLNKFQRELLRSDTLDARAAKLLQISSAARPTVPPELAIRVVDDVAWTAAEIKSCCRTAAVLGCSLIEASEFVPVVHRTNSAELVDISAFAASNGFIDASTGKMLSNKPKTRKRAVTSAN